jgi:riboflavin synthase
VEKGFIAVDGASLTVIRCDAASFDVSLVGYTLQYSTLGHRRPGDVVNLEADIIGKYVEHFTKGRSPAITIDFLEQHGFLGTGRM